MSRPPIHFGPGLAIKTHMGYPNDYRSQAKNITFPNEPILQSIFTKVSRPRNQNQISRPNDSSTLQATVCEMCLSYGDDFKESRSDHECMRGGFGGGDSGEDFSGALLSELTEIDKASEANVNE